MNKKTILDSVKKLVLQDRGLEVVFGLLESNIHRINFVIDGVGTRDCLFIVEEQEGSWRVFLTRDMDTNLNDLDEFYLLSDENEFVDLPVIISNLEKFFLSNGEALNVEVSFYGCRLSKDEEIFLDIALQLGRIESIGFIRRTIKFQGSPKWYAEAVNRSKNDYKCEDQELLYEKQIEELRLDIISKIDSALLSDNRSLFRKYASDYNLLIWGEEKTP